MSSPPDGPAAPDQSFTAMSNRSGVRRRPECEAARCRQATPLTPMRVQNGMPNIPAIPSPAQIFSRRNLLPAGEYIVGPQNREEHSTETRPATPGTGEPLLSRLLRAYSEHSTL